MLEVAELQKGIELKQQQNSLKKDKIAERRGITIKKNQTE